MAGSASSNSESSWWDGLVAAGVHRKEERAKGAFKENQRPQHSHPPSAQPTPSLFEAFCDAPLLFHSEGLHAPWLERQVPYEMLVAMLNDLALNTGLQAALIDRKVRDTLAAMHEQGIAGTNVSHLRCGLSRSTFRLVRRKPLIAWLRWYVVCLSMENGVLPSALDEAYDLHRSDPVVRAAVQGMRTMIGSGVSLTASCEQIKAAYEEADTSPMPNVSLDETLSPCPPAMLMGPCTAFTALAV